LEEKEDAQPQKKRMRMSCWRKRERYSLKRGE
jgi:hypothetical protein